MNQDEYNKALTNLGAMMGLVMEIDFDRLGDNIAFLEALLATVEKTDDGVAITPDMRTFLQNQVGGIRQLYAAARLFRDTMPKELFEGEIPHDDDSTG